MTRWRIEARLLRRRVEEKTGLIWGHYKVIGDEAELLIAVHPGSRGVLPSIVVKGHGLYAGRIPDVKVPVSQ